MTVAMEVRQRAVPADTPPPASPAPRTSLHGASTTSRPNPRIYKSPLDKKYHVERQALLRTGHGLSLAGFVNLLLCLSVLGALSLLFGNISKYGILINPRGWMQMFDAKENVPGFYPALYMLLYLPVQMFIGLWIEKKIASGALPERQGVQAHILSMAVHLAYPVVGTLLAGDRISLVGSAAVCYLNTILFLKQWSFVHACYWGREKSRDKAGGAQGAVDTGSVNGSTGSTTQDARGGFEAAATPAVATEYPNNLGVWNTLYFIIVPTLCYEFDYPRNKDINWRRVAVRFLMCQAACALNLCILQQWMFPAYRSLLVPFATNDYWKVAELLCKVAIPTNLSWLLFFYSFFHVHMIFMSELTRFADRRSYESWWDSEDINAFWRKWNLPVHYWCVRHLYLPLMRAGYSKRAVKYGVFFFSGVFHEYLVSPPLRMFRVYALVAMLCQIPLATLSEWTARRLGPRVGNAVMWLTIVLGQPLGVMLYYRDYVVAHYGEAAIATFGTAT